MKFVRSKPTKKAFTLVELSLAIAFLSLLLIIMAALIISLISIYRKGISINAVNTVGRSIIEDISNSITESGKFSSNDPQTLCESQYPGDSNNTNDCVNDNARKIITQNFTFTRSDGEDAPRAGVLCTGAYSYIWNSGDAINENKTISIKYGSITKKNFNLLKIKDTSRRACKAQLNGSGDYDNDLFIPTSDTINLGSDFDPAEPPTDLITKSDANLAIYYLYVATPTTSNSSSNSFYSGTFVLATLDGGVNIMQTGNYCKPPGDYNSNFDYCAINKFNFATQAIGGI